MISDDFLKNTRTLTMDDCESIFNIVTYRDTVSKAPMPTRDYNAFRDNLAKSFDPVASTRFIGYFENDKLTSYMAQVFSPLMPVWHMAVLSTISNSPWNYKKNGLEFCWANAMSYAESKNIYRIYWSMPVSWARTQYRTINTSDVWKRYDIFVETIVPANTFPVYGEYKISYGRVLKPHDVVVKQGLLKNEFRSFSQQIQK